MENRYCMRRAWKAVPSFLIHSDASAELMHRHGQALLTHISIIHSSLSKRCTGRLEAQWILECPALPGSASMSICRRRQAWHGGNNLPRPLKGICNATCRIQDVGLGDWRRPQW